MATPSAAEPLLGRLELELGVSELARAGALAALRTAAGVVAGRAAAVARERVRIAAAARRACAGERRRARTGARRRVAPLGEG